MSILVEIAEKADVSVVGVVRVLTRGPVSDAIKERVLDVLDDLSPEQTRAVQRFALAALHDVPPRSGNHTDTDLDQVLPELAASSAPAPEQLPATGSDAPLVQLSSVLGELAEAVRDLRRETDAERRERVDDLAVLIDLITTGWQGLDARLGRIERQVGRLESSRREPAPPPLRVAPVAVEAAPIESAPLEAAPVEVAPVEALEPFEPELPPPAEPRWRDRLPVAAALTLVTAAIGTLAVLQLASGGPDLSRLVSAGEQPAKPAGRGSSTATAPATTRPETAPAAGTAHQPPAAQPTVRATTSSVLGTTVAAPRPKPPAATGASGTSSPPPATTRPAATATNPPALRPTRNWAWASVPGADYYHVEFSREGRIFYQASPSAPRLTLPSSLLFRPGSYRWVVRPGFGKPAAKNLGEPSVDLPFTVS